MDIVTHQIFQSTPSAWRETQPIPIKPTKVTISIHSLRMEGDFLRQILKRPANHFNPLPPHGGRRFYNFFFSFTQRISIHSLRMEGDVDGTGIPMRTYHFNPLPPHGGRPEKTGANIGTLQFQSTPSAWRETGLLNPACHTAQDFNPLPPHGGRPSVTHSDGHISVFQSTPSAWRETRLRRCASVAKGFQSTPSAWRETIHSLSIQQLVKYFNPLPPHGGRLICAEENQIFRVFQSTPSAWRETCQLAASTGREKHFNPLPPHGGRLLYGSRQKIVRYFNPLPPHGGRPERSTNSTKRHRAFQSTPSAWRETAKLHRKAFFISPILVQSCKKGCKRLHSAPEKMVFFEKREKNLVRNLQHLSVRL